MIEHVNFYQNLEVAKILFEKHANEFSESDLKSLVSINKICCKIFTPLINTLQKEKYFNFLNRVVLYLKPESATKILINKWHPNCSNLVEMKIARVKQLTNLQSNISELPEEEQKKLKTLESHNANDYFLHTFLNINEIHTQICLWSLKQDPSRYESSIKYIETNIKSPLSKAKAYLRLSEFYVKNDSIDAAVKAASLIYCHRGLAVFAQVEAINEEAMELILLHFLNKNEVIKAVNAINTVCFNVSKKLIFVLRLIRSSEKFTREDVKYILAAFPNAQVQLRSALSHRKKNPTDTGLASHVDTATKSLGRTQERLASQIYEHLAVERNMQEEKIVMEETEAMRIYNIKCLFTQGQIEEALQLTVEVLPKGSYEDIVSVAAESIAVHVKSFAEEYKSEVLTSILFHITDGDLLAPILDKLLREWYPAGFSIPAIACANLHPNKQKMEEYFRRFFVTVQIPLLRRGI